MTNAEGSTKAVELLARSLARWRWGLLLIGVVLAGLWALFERQNRRLEVLGETGEVTQASIVQISRQNGKEFADYEYRVGAERYTGNVDASDLPQALVGKTFSIVYSPSDPSLSIASADRARATTQAASNRSFGRKIVGGLFGFFAFNALICDVRLRRLRKTGQTEATDPQAYRTRLILTGVMLTLILVPLFGWHLADAQQRGESVWPIAAGIVVSLAVLGGTGFYVLREGRARASERSARLLKWAAPLAMGVAAIRLLAWLMGWN